MISHLPAAESERTTDFENGMPLVMKSCTYTALEGTVLPWVLALTLSPGSLAGKHTPFWYHSTLSCRVYNGQFSQLLLGAALQTERNASSHSRAGRGRRLGVYTRRWREPALNSPPIF